MYSFDPEHPFTLVEPLDGESIASFLYRFRRGKEIEFPHQVL